VGAQVGAGMAMAGEGVGETTRTRRFAVRAAWATPATSITSITSLAPLSQGRRFVVRLSALPTSILGAQSQLTARYLDDTQPPPP